MLESNQGYQQESEDETRPTSLLVALVEAPSMLRFTPLFDCNLSF
jgi:hypothetical protein